MTNLQKYPDNMRDFNGPAECQCKSPACAGGRLRVFVPDDGKASFIDRTEQKQQLMLSHKRKSNPSADHIEAMTANLGTNQLGAQSEAMHGGSAKVAASLGVAGAFKHTQDCVGAVGHQSAEAKPKARAKAKAMKTGTGVILIGDLHNDREHVV